MAFTIRILLTSLGANAGPTFNLYSDNDGYVTSFDSATQAQLLAGYTSTLVPDNTTRIKVVSTGTCGTTIYIPITGVPSVTPSVTPSITKTPSLTPSETPSVTPSRSVPTVNWPTPPPRGTGAGDICCGIAYTYFPGPGFPPTVGALNCFYYTATDCYSLGLIPCSCDEIDDGTGPGGGGEP